MKKIASLLLLCVLLPLHAHADRYYLTGMEWQNAGSGYEWTTTTNSPAISTSVKHGGSASLLLTGVGAASSEGFTHTLSTAYSHFYLRYYIYVDSLSSTGYTYVGIKNGANYNGAIRLRDVGGTLDMLVEADNGSGAITDTATLSYDTWHMIEINANTAPAAGSDTLRVLVDGVDVALATNLTLTGTPSTLEVALYNSGGSVDNTSIVYIDDIAINNSNNTLNGSFPGAGKIVAAVPNAAGKSACNGGLFSAVNEIPVSDTNTSTANRCELTTNGVVTGMFNLTDASTLGIGSNDSIHAVSTLFRVVKAGTAATNWTPYLFDGTGTSSGAIADPDDGQVIRTNPVDTTPFASYVLSNNPPSSASPWTTSLIDSMQIGAGTTDGNPDVYILSMVAMIDFNDAPDPTPAPTGPLYYSVGKLLVTGGKLTIN